MPTFEPVIGLEVHAELLTQSKMFCGCAVVDTTIADPNTSVCEICTGMPGTLPVINARAVEYALRVALALNCEIAETSVFARKNYFYPDLPKGFQISQYELPLAVRGLLKLRVDGSSKEVPIRRVHLEEDTGKLYHREGYSLVDYNRSGVPLLEIVSEPALFSIEELKLYAVSLRSLLRYLRVNSGDMEKGVIRFEANVSVRPSKSNVLGTRTEIKNLNSFRALLRAVAFEIERQEELLNRGKPVLQETLGWDEVREITLSQRGKEEAHDYRYFPEPDLPPLKIDSSWIDQIRSELPELPDAKHRRFVEAFGLSDYTAEVLVADRDVAEYFEHAVVEAGDVPPAEIANWISGELFALLNQTGRGIRDCKVSPRSLAALVQMVEDGELNPAGGKEVLDKMFASGGDPAVITQELGISQISDAQEIETFVEQVLRENPDQVDEYLGGKQSLGNWFFGQVMHATQGRANPEMVRPALESALRNLREERGPGG
jgi:aspartyl-tRNA(Asn)/glutamyl-tRNA(Gln) amidotransferase subunit B